MVLQLYRSKVHKPVFKRLVCYSMTIVTSNSVSWMIPCLEVLYFASFASFSDNQLLMSAILSLIHFQRIPYFKTKAVEPGLNLNSQTIAQLFGFSSNNF